MKRTFIVFFLLLCGMGGTQAAQTLHATWTDSDYRLLPNELPGQCFITEEQRVAWRGERLGLRALVWTDAEKAEEGVTLRLRPTTQRARTWQTDAHFLGWVLTDSFNTCGYAPANLPPFAVADVIGPEKQKVLSPDTIAQVWCTIEVPRECRPGTYDFVLDVVGNSSRRRLASLELSVQVIDRTLPKPTEQHLHIDFWQQPYAVSRFHDVPRWSQQHFDLLRGYLQLLARAGQRVITTTLFYEPWGEQSNDLFDAMIGTTREEDGTWTFDYTVFDHWVELCDSCGVGPQINCFSMVPWDMSFRYFDAFAQQYIDLKTTTDSPSYEALWTAFLKAFAQHLKEKGWLERTLIAMDERGLPNMLDAWRVAQQAVPGMQMALAGNYHAELADKLRDYSVAYGQKFSPEELALRHEKGFTTTVYTCCSEQRPNTFTNSQPIEALYAPLYGLANGFDGFLHWSWMNWTDDPLHDSRYKLFAPGDTYLIYPGPQSSVRWERFIEGVQLAEKTFILMQSHTPGLQEALAAFATENPGDTAETIERVNRLKALVNR